MTKAMSKYILNVDWLAIYGSQSLRLAKNAFGVRPSDIRGHGWGMEVETLSERDRMMLEGIEFQGCRQHIFGNLILDVQEYGTRQYNVLFHVYYGRELFGYLQAYPRTSAVRPDSFILKVANRYLYRYDCWDKLQYVLSTLNLQAKSISRLDIAADFETFQDGTHPVDFIRMFMAGEIKHKGRAEGAVNFLQRYAYVQKDKRLEDYLKFNALTMGKHSSDAHCYLYNKSVELKEVMMKPYIQDAWKQAGFDVDNVWRLEVSLKSKALYFVDKNSGMEVQFNLCHLLHPTEDMNVAVLYFVMLKALFFFFRPTGQKNISREKMIQLFDDSTEIDRGIIRDKNTSNRSERILIKALHTLALRYRGVTNEERWQAIHMAEHLAQTMNLSEWVEEKKDQWRNTKLKA